MYAQSVARLPLHAGARQPIARTAERSLRVRSGRTFCYLYLRMCRKLGRLDRCAGRYH